MNKNILALTLAISFLKVSTPAGAATPPETPPAPNQETIYMQNMLRPYLDLDFNPPSGIDKDRPSIREIATNIVQALPARLSAPVGHPKRILVLTCKPFGQLHVPGQGGLLELLRGAEKKYGAFELTERCSIEGIDAAFLAKFDCVVLNSISNIEEFSSSKDNEFFNQLLPAYVRNGGGLLATHGSALFLREHPDAEYNNMLGGCSVAPAGKVHPKGHTAVTPITLPEPENPLVAAFRGEPKEVTYLSCQIADSARHEWPVTIKTPFELADELYVLNPQSNKNNASRVLVAVDRDKLPKGNYPSYDDDFSYALIWNKAYGKGRVYYTELGHDQAIFSVPCVAEATLDGLQYALGDLPVPAKVLSTAPSGK